ncbi:LacI family DNA-binding transcriptional regulator [Pseudarthrobacter siccitolerans]|uniref:LacI family DNA-binding transcriptional regulator n=1 Tax=Pseudarthrobacter siccitolerans TaxID=861266 RepID=UPI002E0FF98E|nr:LacI family DNA-binding transcriptional regulator [Pseudarthrobacter siccitolerans]
MQDVAEAAGVSTATVSNVLNRPQFVAPRTRVRVLDAIEALGYERNEHAALLRLGRSAGSGALQEREEVGLPIQDGDVRYASSSISNRPQRRGPRQQRREAQRSAQLRPTGPEMEVSELPKPGHRIRIRYEGKFVGGTVEIGMPDGSAFWVWCDGIGRKLVAVPDTSSDRNLR